MDDCHAGAGISPWLNGLSVYDYPDRWRDDIEKAFTKGEILRTHLMRPTWHFVAPADIRWLLALTAPRVHTASAFMYRQLELDTKMFKRSNDTIIKALSGGKQLTREQLRAALEQKKIKADGFRLAYLLMKAELDGIICSGARQGKQFTYALLEERVAPAKTDSQNRGARRIYTTLLYKSWPGNNKRLYHMVRPNGC